MIHACMHAAATLLALLERTDYGYTYVRDRMHRSNRAGSPIILSPEPYMHAYNKGDYLRTHEHVLLYPFRCTRM